jgi:S-formylglutathione hydrolase FrmB
MPRVRHGKRLGGLLAALALTAGTSAALTVPASAQTPASTRGCTQPAPLCLSTGYATPDGATIVSENVIDTHTEDLVVKSPAVGTTVSVRLMLPADYWAKPTQTFPTLFLMEGSGDNYDYMGWFAHTNIEQFLWNQNVLTVLPTDYSAGMYTDWLGHSNATDSTPKWETFHTVELPDLLAHEYRANGTNAIMGASAGGLGAIDYAERHPGEFAAAASLSGLLDTQSVGGLVAVPAMQNRAGDDWFGPYGTPGTTDSDWAEHNPVMNAAALKAAGVSVFVSSGDGEQGAYDTTFQWDSWLAESQALDMSQSFATAAKAAGVALTTDFYGAGGHNWPYWNAEWPKAWKVLEAGLNPPPVATISSDAPPVPAGVEGSQPFPS